MSLAVAFGTISAVAIALFGQAFRAKYFPPKLSLTVIHPEGEKTKVRLTWFDGSEQKELWEDARYYHVNVQNSRRWSPANQTQVFLMQFEEPGPDGEFQTTWRGDIPLSWRHQEVFPPSRTIGPNADCDLCSVVKGKWLQFHPLVTPYNLDIQRLGKSIFILSMQARSNEGDSSILRVQVAWDGGWHDGSEEMKHHLTVKVLNDEKA